MRYCTCGHDVSLHERVAGIIDPCIVDDCDCGDFTTSPRKSVRELFAERRSLRSPSGRDHNKEEHMAGKALEARIRELAARERHETATIILAGGFEITGPVDTGVVDGAFQMFDVERKKGWTIAVDQVIAIASDD